MLEQRVWGVLVCYLLFIHVGKMMLVLRLACDPGFAFGACLALSLDLQ